jgi:outer membrane protein assembly factor BamB
LWQVPLGASVAAPPLVVGDAVIVAQDDGALQALSRSSREVLWKVSLDSPVSGSLAYAEGKIFAQTESGNLHVIR